MGALLVISELRKPRSRLTPTSARTREQLIIAGERLFAERGIDNVSLRQINAEAGQRNSSASHYHFGSKESLVGAIYAYRMERLNARRNAFINGLPAAVAPRPVPVVVGTLIYPLVEEIDSPGGRHAIQFLAQLLAHPMTNLFDMWRSELGESVGRVYGDLKAALPEVPDEVLGPRFGMMWVLAINALADRERLSSVAVRSVSEGLPVLFVSNLVDVLAGLIAAPISDATRAEVSDLRGRLQRTA